MKSLIYVIMTFSLSVFAIPNEHDVSNMIKRGGRPTRADLVSLKQKGFKTIINLENVDSAISAERKYAEQLGFNFILSELDTHATPDDVQINKIMEVLNDPSLYPIYIHCYHGQDRTGMVIGVYRVLENQWNQNDAYNEMLKYGFHPKYAELKNYFFEKTKK